MTDYSIDAAGKSLGRVAAEAAKALMGKTSPDYTPHKRSNVKVTVTNASKMHVPEKKKVQKSYVRYSGYPGGLKFEQYAHLSKRRGVSEPLRRAVYRMLPRNTFRTPRMKNLIITE